MSGLADYYAKFANSPGGDVSNGLSNWVPFSTNFQLQSQCQISVSGQNLDQLGCEIISRPEDVPTLMMDELQPLNNAAYWDNHWKQNNNSSEIAYHLRRANPFHPDIEKLGFAEHWEAGQIDRIFNDNIHSLAGAEWAKDPLVKVQADGQTIEVDNGEAPGSQLSIAEQGQLELVWESDFIYKVPDNTTIRNLLVHFMAARKVPGTGFQFTRFEVRVVVTAEVGGQDYNRQYEVDLAAETVTQFASPFNLASKLVTTSVSAGQDWENWQQISLRMPDFDAGNLGPLRKIKVTIQPLTSFQGAVAKVGAFLLTSEEFATPASFGVGYVPPLELVRSDISGNNGQNTSYEIISFDPDSRTIDGNFYQPIGTGFNVVRGFRIRHNGGIGWISLGGNGEVMSMDFPSDPGPPIEFRDFRPGSHDDQSDVDDATYTNVSDPTTVGSDSYSGYRTRSASDTELPIVANIFRHDFPNGLAMIHSGFRQLLPAPQTPFYSTGPDPGQNSFVSLQRSRESITNTIQIVNGAAVRSVDPDSGDGVLRLASTSVLYSVSSTQERVCTWTWAGNAGAWLTPIAEGGVDWRPNPSTANVEIDLLDYDGYDDSAIVSFLRYDRTANISGPSYADSRSIAAGGNDITESLSTTKKLCVAVNGVLKSERTYTGTGVLRSNVAYTDGGAIWFVYDEATDLVTMHVDDGANPVSLTTDVALQGTSKSTDAKVVGFTRDRFYVHNLELTDQLSSGNMSAWMFSYDLTVQVPVHRIIVGKESADVSNPANWPIRQFVGNTSASEITCPIDNIDGLDFCPQTSDFGKMGEPPEDSKFPSRVPV